MMSDKSRYRIRRKRTTPGRTFGYQAAWGFVIGALIIFGAEIYYAVQIVENANVP